LVQYNRGSVYCTVEVAKMIGTVINDDKPLGYHVKVYWIDTQRTIWERRKDIQLLEDIICPGDISST